MEEKPIATIDAAIDSLEKYIEYNRSSGFRIMMYLVTFSFIFPVCIISFVSAVSYSLPETLTYALVGVFIIVFGVLMAIYRFHLNEIAKAEHSKLGFMRIRVAANNHDKEGFLSEVRIALTDKAFDYFPSTVFGGKGKKVESPLPGHPVSDISTIMLNKVFEEFEFRKKQ